MKVKTLNLALQGGGAHGAFAWGVLDRLLEDGRISIDDICATSAGAMNAVVFAYGNLKGGRDGAREALHNFWYKVSKSGHDKGFGQLNPFSDVLKNIGYNMFAAMSHVISPYQFNPLNFNVLRDILESQVDFDELKANKNNNLFISTTNIRTGNVRIFSNDELSVDVVMASACLPNLFQAVQIGDDFYWDGGYMGNPSIFPLFYRGNTKDVMVVHINPLEREKVPTQGWEISNRLNEITFNSSLLKEYRTIAFINKLLEEGWIKEEFKDRFHSMYIHSIRADAALQDLDVSTKFNTDWNFLKQLRNLGRLEAEKWLNDNFNRIGKESTLDLKEVVCEADLGYLVN
jgi:NTE family protein